MYSEEICEFIRRSGPLLLPTLFLSLALFILLLVTRVINIQSRAARRTPWPALTFYRRWLPILTVYVVCQLIHSWFQLFHWLTRLASYSGGTMNLFMSRSVLVRMPNLALDGPSEQLLAEGTRSTHVVVSLLASAVQYSLMTHGLSKVGLVPLMSQNLAASLSM